MPHAPLYVRAHLPVAADLLLQGRPDTGGQLFHGVFRVQNVPVEPPVRVVVVSVAGAGVGHGPEAEPRLDDTVGVEAPLRGVAVPPGRALRENAQRAVFVLPEGYPHEVAAVRVFLEN